MDIPSVVSSLKGVGFAGWTVLETPPTSDPTAACRRNLKYLRKLL